MNLLKNPILPGFYPDPSVCAVDGHYYLVTSTFAFFPGVPVFHSTDLVHWEQIGHCLDRPEQLPLAGVRASQGIYASTIRYHDGLFYMVTTLVQDPPYWGNVNFFVTAKDPAGPWSDPVVVQGAQGIDPTLFFDDDGQAYYLGNLRPYPDRQSSARHLWIQKLDIATGRLLDEPHVLLTDGAVHNAHTPEGPHIYHINGWYYLLIAEGGTSHDHAISVFRSRELFGPYECDPRNPICTHRTMRKPAAIHSVGHSDLVQLANGEWWAVMLASRPDGGDYRILGRETFAVPVDWEDEWPVYSPETGRVEFSFPAPALPPMKVVPEAACDHFDAPELGLCWNHLRTPEGHYWNLTERPGFLRLYGKKTTVCEQGNPAMVLRRQQHLCADGRTVLEVSLPEGTQAGMIAWMNENYHLRAELSRENGERVLSAVRRFAGADEVLASVTLPEGTEKVWLLLEAEYQYYHMYYALEPGKYRALATGCDGSHLCREAAGGFTGTYWGVYCQGEGARTDVDWFEYKGRE